MGKRLLPLLLSAALATQVHAQADSAGADVFGTVYDSVAARPLAGAVVQLVSTVHGAPYSATATTGPNGAYALHGIPAGEYVVGFQHQALDTLSLSSPMRQVTVAALQRVRVDLAVPSPRTIVRAICGDSAADSTGLLIGMLRDARTGLAIDSGFAAASWDVFSIMPGGIRRVSVAAQSTVTAMGWFTLCRLPAGVDLALSGWSGADSSGAFIASVPAGGLSRRDIAVGGVATVHGVLLAERGRPISNGRISIAGREGETVTDSAGRFRLGEIRAGTQTLEARALGYGPVETTLQLRADQDTALVVTMLTLRHMLDTMKVIAQRVYSRDFSGFEHRRRVGDGFFLTADDIQRRRPYDVYSLLNEAPSLRVQYGSNSGAASGGGFGSALDRTVVMRGGVNGTCVPDVYVDGIQMRDVSGQIDMLVRPDEIAGIEVYQSGRAPAQFTSALSSGCGVIVIWTQPATRAPRRRRPQGFP